MMRSEIYSEEHKKLREILKRERKAAGLRQQDVADKTNRSQEYISKFERGGLRLDVIDLLQLCKAIGYDPIDVILELENPEGYDGRLTGAIRNPDWMNEVGSSDQNTKTGQKADRKSKKPIRDQRSTKAAAGWINCAERRSTAPLRKVWACELIKGASQTRRPRNNYTL